MLLTSQILTPCLVQTLIVTGGHNLDRMVMDYVALPKDFLKSHHFVTIFADVMFVNGAPFLIIMSPGVKFVNLKHVPTNTANKFSKS